MGDEAVAGFLLETTTTNGCEGKGPDMTKALQTIGTGIWVTIKWTFIACAICAALAVALYYIFVDPIDFKSPWVFQAIVTMLLIYIAQAAYDIEKKLNVLLHRSRPMSSE